MTDKERLESIESAAEHKFLSNIEGEVKYQFTEINTDDYDWLIEQAKRVQEIEQQNKRYREALENIRNVKYDDDFNPYAYMKLEIFEWAEDALEGEE